MDDVVTQLGLLLTQTRYARRALEDIERATAQYGALSMAVAAAPGEAFGAPPLQDGALRVHVVNISDLAPGGGLADTLAAWFGGVGSFVGNLLGGAVGGTLGSLRLAAMLPTIDRLAGRIERIVDKLGLARAAQASPATPVPGTPAAMPAAAGGQSEFLATLKLDAVTTLLQVAGGGRPATSSGPDATAAPDAERWRVWVDSLTAVLDAGTRLVRGLTIAVPIAISAVSWLIDRLPDLRTAITDTLRYIVRNVLVLRGAVLVLGLETSATIARVAAMAIRTLSAAVTEALTALFAALANLLDGALKLVGVLGEATVSTVKALLEWLVPAVDAILRNLGELRVFRLVAKIVDVLPQLLALAGTPDPKKTSGTAANSVDPGRPPLPAPPADLAALMTKAGTDAAAAAKQINMAASDFVTKPTTKLSEGLTTFAQRLDEQAIKEVELSDTNLAKRLGTLGARATTSATTLLPPDPATASADTAFRPIAAAYGAWLSGGGLNRMLDSITTYFQSPQGVPASGAPEHRPASGSVVRIEEVIIDIAATPATGTKPYPERGTNGGPDDCTLPRSGDLLERVTRQQLLDEIRGSRGQRRPHIPVFE